MRSRQRLAISGLLSLLALTVLFGCRAFQPEVVVVNKPPETYIMGAPAETSGGYFHYHVWWYGTDVDGTVTRYVWALTDSSIQDHTLEGDEEDTRFNPATHVSTLRIGHWTTLTDSVFDFQVNQGANLSYDMTLHLVAVDDQGDFDRTPARLYFISNAIGNPALTFYMTVGGVTRQVSSTDTVGFGVPFAFSWTAATPNIRSYTPQQLAEVDTVPPADGLLGFKYRIMDVNCDASNEDCWHPRQFETGTGDSVSYFGLQQSLRFFNDNSGADAQHKRLASGAHRILVNTIDVAGVEVPSNKQAFTLISNYDPDTRLLRGETDPVFTDDPEVYPYYIVYHKDGETVWQEKHPFVEGERVPDKAYVVFKALGWDDARDMRRGAGGVHIQGAFAAVGLYGGTSNFRFASDYSDTLAPAWSNAAGVCADTLGFLVGPFDYTLTMRSVDEHQRRDETPETFRFSANHKPCVQCVEVLVGSELQSTGPFTCQDGDCAGVDEIYAAAPFSPPPPGDTRRYATSVAQDSLWYKVTSGEVRFNPPPSITQDWSFEEGYTFEYRLALHGADDPLETWDPERPQDRIPAWYYQIQSQGAPTASPPLTGDPGNTIHEGAGVDDSTNVTYDWDAYNASDPNQMIFIDDEGVWVLRIRFFVANSMLYAGGNALLTSLRDRYPGDYQHRFEMITRQLGQTTATVKARDVSNCSWNAQRSMFRHYFGVRAPAYTGTDRDLHPRWNCDLTFPGERKRALDPFFFVSSPYVKTYTIRVRTIDNQVYP